MTATRPLAVARGYLAVHAAEGLRGLLAATIIYRGIASAFCSPVANDLVKHPTALYCFTVLPSLHL